MKIKNQQLLVSEIEVVEGIQNEHRKNDIQNVFLLVLDVHEWSSWKKNVESFGLGLPGILFAPIEIEAKWWTLNKWFPRIPRVFRTIHHIHPMKSTHRKVLPKHDSLWLYFWKHLRHTHLHGTTTPPRVQQFDSWQCLCGARAPSWGGGEFWWWVLAGIGGCLSVGCI